MTSLDFWKHRKPASAPTAFPGADALRIGIVHARWNAAVVDALVGAAIDTLLAAGVAHDHIVVESVPGSWELPFGAMSLIEATQAATDEDEDENENENENKDQDGDLAVGGVRTTAGGQTAQEQKQDHQGQGQEQEQEQEVRLADTVGGDGAKARPRGALDALIGIGVLIKGDTMHFECIANSCCNGLMQLGMASKTPVILGVLCCLSEDQAMERAGIGRGEFPGHNHGVDWAHAALEMSIKHKGHVRGKVRVMD